MEQLQHAPINLEQLKLAYIASPEKFHSLYGESRKSMLHHYVENSKLDMVSFLIEKGC